MSADRLAWLLHGSYRGDRRVDRGGPGGLRTGRSRVGASPGTTGVNRRKAEPLLLDEMFAPALAEQLRAAGFDVVGVAGHPVLSAAPDTQVAQWAIEHDRRVVTENVRDFAPMAGRGEPPLRVLFTSSRRFLRSRRNPGPLLKALSGWLGDEVGHPVESWLR
jgi:hypothetical protein